MIPILIRLALGGLNIFKAIGTLLGRFFASLNAQGVIGLAASLFLAFLWLRTGGEARHWHKQSDQFQKLYTAEKNALDQTKANLLAARNKAKAEDAANVERVKAEQSAINERSAHDFETRIAAARAAAERLQRASAAHPGSGGNSPVPGLSSAPGGTAEAAGQDRLSPTDALTATEQAIQLDELISWARRQHQVDPNKATPHG